MHAASAFRRWHPTISRKSCCFFFPCKGRSMPAVLSVVRKFSTFRRAACQRYFLEHRYQRRPLSGKRIVFSSVLEPKLGSAVLLNMPIDSPTLEQDEQEVFDSLALRQPQRWLFQVVLFQLDPPLAVTSRWFASPRALRRVASLTVSSNIILREFRWENVALSVESFRRHWSSDIQIPSPYCPPIVRCRMLETADLLHKHALFQLLRHAYEAS